MQQVHSMLNYASVLNPARGHLQLSRSVVVTVLCWIHSGDFCWSRFRIERWVVARWLDKKKEKKKKRPQVESSQHELPSCSPPSPCFTPPNTEVVVLKRVAAERPRHVFCVGLSRLNSTHSLSCLFTASFDVTVQISQLHLSFSFTALPLERQIVPCRRLSLFLFPLFFFWEVLHYIIPIGFSVIAA